MRQLPASTRTATARHATTEATKPSTSTAETSTTKTAPSAPSASTPPWAAAEEQPPEQDFSERAYKNENDNNEDPRDCLRRNPIVRFFPPRRSQIYSGQLDPRVLRNRIRNMLRHQADSAVVVALLEERHSFAPEAAYFTVRKNGLKTIPDFGAVAMIFYRKKDQNTAIGRLVADSPFLEQVNRVALDIVSIERIDRDHGHLRVRFLINLQAEIVEVADRAVTEHMCEIIDVVAVVEL